MKKIKLLLHSCCGPCSTAVIEKLKNDFDLSVFFFNPNIYPDFEYQKRLSEQKRFLKENCPGIKLFEEGHNSNLFDEISKGLEDCEEGGKRCEKCFYLRLKRSAQFAKEKGFDFFATTLSISPHKNVKLINKIGKELEEKNNIKFLEADFKKKDGYLHSLKISKEHNLYRQNYCGCRFSLKKSKN